MAITGTIAGPLFNVLCGLGAANTYSNLDPNVINNPKYRPYVVFSMYSETEPGVFEFNPVSVLPLALMVGQFFILCLILVNGFCNKFYISYKWCWLSAGFYLLLLVGLIAYALVDDVKAPTG